MCKSNWEEQIVGYQVLTGAVKGVFDQQFGRSRKKRWKDNGKKILKFGRSVKVKSVDKLVNEEYTAKYGRFLTGKWGIIKEKNKEYKKTVKL